MIARINCSSPPQKYSSVLCVNWLCVNAHVETSSMLCQCFFLNVIQTLNILVSYKRSLHSPEENGDSMCRGLLRFLHLWVHSTEFYYDSFIVMSIISVPSMARAQLPRWLRRCAERVLRPTSEPSSSQKSCDSLRSLFGASRHLLWTLNVSGAEQFGLLLLYRLQRWLLYDYFKHFPRWQF